MKRSVCILSAALLLFSVQAAFGPDVVAGEKSKADEKRAKIDANEREALERLFSESDKAKRLHDRAYGHAVFSNMRVSLGVTGGGGTGVAVNKATGERTYMKMGTAGLNLGLGAQKYMVVFLFEDEGTFRTFVDKGWEAGGSASAVAGTAGVNAEATFINGMAVFQLTEGGLMLQADISGTKYWKHKKLNR